MTNEQATKLAEAMGYALHVRYPDSPGPDYTEYAWLLVKDKYSTGPQSDEAFQLASRVPPQRWEDRPTECNIDFNSPEGRKAVREFVKREIGGKGLQYNYEKIGDKEYHRITIGWEVLRQHQNTYDPHTRGGPDFEFDETCDTEPEAYAAAALWIAEKKGGE